MAWKLVGENKRSVVNGWTVLLPYSWPPRKGEAFPASGAKDRANGRVFFLTRLAAREYVKAHSHHFPDATVAKARVIFEVTSQP